MPVRGVGFFSDQISAPIVLAIVPTDFVRLWLPLKTTLAIVFPTARYPSTTDNTVSPGFTVTGNVVVNGSATEVDDAGDAQVLVLIFGSLCANAGNPSDRRMAS